ncbi:hypothetical protein [Streptomyces sp. NBC_01568]|uniref:hypothetical protein n=1 Tax=Streptomyces sp. NBC_01568 TaxID=2975882 RepID=UPI0038702E12
MHARTRQRWQENMVRPSEGPESQKKQACALERLKELRAIAERARLAADQAEAALLDASVDLMLDRVLDPQGAAGTSEIANASGIRSRILSKAAGSSPMYAQLLKTANEVEES